MADEVMKQKREYEAVLARTAETADLIRPLSPYHSSMITKIYNLGQVIAVFSSEIQLLASIEIPDADLADQEQLKRRAATRTIFAMIEAITYHMKQLAIQHAEYYPNTFSLAQLALLREETYLLEKNGTTTQQQAKISTLPNLRFAFASFSTALNIPHKLDVSDNNWEALQSGLRIRDRLMHPKEASNLVVTEPEMDQLLAAHTWHTMNMQICIEQGMESLLASFQPPSV